MNLLPTSHAVSTDPGPKIRGLIALLLRVGLGLSFFSSGLRDYVLTHRNFGSFAPGITTPVAPMLEVLPFLELAIGLALIVGFFTTAIAVIAGVVLLLSSTVQALVAANFGPGGPPMLAQFMAYTSQVQSGLPASVVLTAAVLWFSTVENNPWSLDRFIFPGRRADAQEWAADPEPGPEELGPGPLLTPVEPAPPPGTRAAKFIASREP